jgi:hypothetical protein
MKALVYPGVLPIFIAARKRAPDSQKERDRAASRDGADLVPMIRYNKGKRYLVLTELRAAKRPHSHALPNSARAGDSSSLMKSRLSGYFTLDIRAHP